MHTKRPVLRQSSQSLTGGYSLFHFVCPHCPASWTDSCELVAHCPVLCVSSREIKEGWPLLTVETEAYGDSSLVCTVHMKGVRPWLVQWAILAGTRDFGPDLAALIGPVRTLFFSSPYTFSLHLSPPPVSEYVTLVKTHLQFCWGYIGWKNGMALNFPLSFVYSYHNNLVSRAGIF